MTTRTYPMHIINPTAYDPLARPELMPLDRLGFETDLAVKPDVTAANPQHVRNVRVPAASAGRVEEYEQQRTIPIDLAPNGAIRLLVADLGEGAS